MAVVSNMSEGGNEPQEDPISEEPGQPEREHEQVQRSQDTREDLSNRTEPPVATLSNEEYAAWLQARIDEELPRLTPAQRARLEADPNSVTEPINSGRGRIPAARARQHPQYLSTSEQRSDFDLYSLREPISSGGGLIPYPPTGPPPPYPYDEEAERTRLSRGPNPNGGTPARRFWNRLVRPERRAPPVVRAVLSICDLASVTDMTLFSQNDVPRQTGQQTRGTSDNLEPPPYSRFEASGQDPGDDYRYFDAEFAQLFRLWPTGQPPESNQPAEAQNLASNVNDGDFNQLFRLWPTGQPESNQPAEAQNLPGNENDSEFNQYYQLVSSEQHLGVNQQGASEIEDLQGDPELPPYTPSEGIGHEDLEEDPWDGQDPWDYYMAAIEAGQNPPDGQEPYMPDLGQVHDEWLRMIQRNRRGVNRAAR